MDDMAGFLSVLIILDKRPRPDVLQASPVHSGTPETAGIEQPAAPIGPRSGPAGTFIHHPLKFSG